jgi:hypothetical protein
MQRKWMREPVVHNLCHGCPGTRDLKATPEIVSQSLLGYLRLVAAPTVMIGGCPRLW